VLRFFTASESFFDDLDPLRFKKPENNSPGERSLPAKLTRSASKGRTRDSPGQTKNQPGKNFPSLKLLVLRQVKIVG